MDIGDRANPFLADLATGLDVWVRDIEHHI
jgi:hypothetical protein